MCCEVAQMRDLRQTCASAYKAEVAVTWSPPPCRIVGERLLSSQTKLAGVGWLFQASSIVIL